MTIGARGLNRKRAEGAADLEKQGEARWRKYLYHLSHEMANQ